MNEDTTFISNHDYDFGKDNNTDNHEVATSSIADDAPTDKKNKGGVQWKKVALGAGTGVLLGGASAMAMSMGKDSGVTAPADEDNATQDGHDSHDGMTHPELIIGELDLATHVDDSMSFGEAFAAARAEVGSGGIFEWHGNIYATYTAKEWDSMSAQEREDFNDHFAWNHHSHHAKAHDHQHDSTIHNDLLHDDAHQAAFNDDVDDAEVIDLDETEVRAMQAYVGQISDFPDDVEVLGVVHDGEAGTTMATIDAGDHEVILVDVNDDSIFDFMASDVDGSGQMEDDEIVDISSLHLTVDDFGGITDQASINMPFDSTGDKMCDAYDGCNV